jgi:4-hydroxybenzoate polyprenyltransferase
LAAVYSNRKFGFRRFFLYNNLNATLIFAVFPIMINFFLLGPSFSFLAALYLLVIVFVTSTVKDYEDALADKNAGIETIPNNFGFFKSSIFVFLSMLMVYFLILLASVVFAKYSLYFFPSLVGIFLSVVIFKMLLNFKQAEGIKTHHAVVSKVLLISYFIQMLYLLFGFFMG